MVVFSTTDDGLSRAFVDGSSDRTDSGSDRTVSLIYRLADIPYD
jgi:hypothetical protein